jgi:CheY-like chemotaxis protein
MAVLEILDGGTPVDAILMDMQMPGMEDYKPHALYARVIISGTFPSLP